MSTVGQLIDATLNRWLYGTYRTRTNILNSDILETADNVPCKYPPVSVGTGSLIAIDDELMEVIGVPQNNNLPVIRGVRGTAQDVHTAPATIDINPRYPRLSVRAAMLDEIVSWPETMFNVQPFAITTDPTGGTPSATIDVSTTIAPAKVRRVLAVWRQSKRVTDDRWYSVDFNSAKDARAIGTCDIYLSSVDDCTGSYRVIIGTDFVTDIFTDDTDLQAYTGIPRSAEDVLQLGAAWRLVTGHEAKRLYTEQQGESREAAETGTLDLARFGAQLMQMRDAGLAREAGRLKDRYGIGVSG